MERVDDYFGGGASRRGTASRPPAQPSTAHSASATTDSERTKSFKKRWADDDDAWTSVDHQELDHATSHVSESMYLVMDLPSVSMREGEVVFCRVHALCDQSSSGLIGASASAPAAAATAGSGGGSGRESKHGTLFLTNFRLLFLAFGLGSSGNGGGAHEVVEVPLNNVAELAELRVGPKAAGGAGAMAAQLEVACKNFEILKFNFPSDAASGDLYVRINQVLASKQAQLAYASADLAALPDSDGWGVFDPASEFARLGFRAPGHSGPGFRVSLVNSNYKMSPTYPSSLVVPAGVSDAELRKISHFRARGRVPAVTYRHSNGAVVARCSQPLVGLRRKRCASDEAYMAALRRESTGKLLFVDCRSQTSAYGNIALGGGFEVLDYYRETSIMFMGIENIHSMRDSIRKLFELVKNEARGNERSNWLSCLESTRWLEHVRSVLAACSLCVAKLTDEGTSLLVHCSDGWDRTAQLVALTKLCADPFYRTTRGFQVLVEHEWCAFGHQFRARSGHSPEHAGYWEDEHASPVFMQFVDAVWQLMRQFPCSFEFNELYLIALLDEVYAKRSGTFLHDCEESRVGSMTPTRCVSAWTLLERSAKAGDFRNSFYVAPFRGDALSDRSPRVLQFKWHPSSVALWQSFYLRSLEARDSRVSQEAWAKELQVTQRELQHELSSAYEQLHSQAAQNSELVSELEALRRESARLRSALQGQVFRDDARGLLVHASDDDEDDGVVVSVTAVAPPRPARKWPFASRAPSPPPPPSGLDAHQHGYNLPSAFVGGAMTAGFEILHSYFDPAHARAGSAGSAGASSGGDAATSTLAQQQQRQPPRAVAAGAPAKQPAQ